MLKTLCVFCASSSKVDESYLQAAQKLGEICAENHIHVLYGGGGVGLMGALANSILKRQGKLTGIIPEFMKQLNWAHSEVNEMIVVEDMRERKRRLIENVDAVVALPGGVGTLEELLEVITLKQLGRMHIPIFIINTNGFYNPLLRFFDEMIEKNFLHEKNKLIWTVLTSPEEIIAAYKNQEFWDANQINNGAL